MVLRYCLNKGQKLSCNKMQEKILLSYPTLFDIPATHHITSKVNKWLRIFRAARKKRITLEGVQDEIRKKNKIPLVYANCIESLVRENIAMKPRMFEDKIIERLHLNRNQFRDDFPSTDTLKKNVTAVKTRLRKDLSN